MNPDARGGADRCASAVYGVAIGTRGSLEGDASLLDNPGGFAGALLALTAAGILLGIASAILLLA
ncbi:MAG TPA: hypothetical protein VGC32_17465 [Solirubrobacterales bacterium]